MARRVSERDLAARGRSARTCAHSVSSARAPNFDEPNLRDQKVIPQIDRQRFELPPPRSLRRRPAGSARYSDCGGS